MKGWELIKGIQEGTIKEGQKIIQKYRGNEAKLKVSCGWVVTDDGDYRWVMHTMADNDSDFELVEEPKGWFKPEYGEKYFFITHHGDINAENMDNFEGDKYRVSNHNCFRTTEEAQEYLDYKTALREAEKPFVNGEERNYYIMFDAESERLVRTNCILGYPQGTILLGQDKKVAQAFIDKWEKQILKFEFNIWSN